MTHAYGHREQLSSGSWRAKVYAGKDPLSGREIRFRKTRKTEVEAQIELGKLLELARAGRKPDSDITVAELLDAYVPVAGWDVSTLETNLGYVRRTIKPALGTREVRKVRGPLLGMLPTMNTAGLCWTYCTNGPPRTQHGSTPRRYGRRGDLNRRSVPTASAICPPCEPRLRSGPRVSRVGLVPG